MDWLGEEFAIRSSFSLDVSSCAEGESERVLSVPRERGEQERANGCGAAVCTGRTSRQGCRFTAGGAFSC